MKIIAQWIEFFQFMKKPLFLQEENNIISKFKITFSLLILQIIFVGLVTLVISLILIHYFGLKADLPNENLQLLYNPVILFAMVAVLEEFSFRGFLKKFNPLFFSISVAGISGIYFKKLYYHNMVFEPQGLMEMGILVICIFTISLFFAKKNTVKMSVFWDNHQHMIIIASAVLFAFIHFFNHNNLDLVNLPLIISQLLSALIFSFVRMRSGLIFAILLHFIWDLVLGF
ncbi:CPBP family glutamic-type intramembrane protease [Chryseobacterium luteum]|uniref:CAAX prenyl protease 2/Lysostaphin resistance protein A-like domain-containing protein n=1 Tax=Chryseobacterium luteum TaxID=421531 RepID=A0A085Z6E8_9FLAO|nr:CPBP family glutamic-type intramembrane protease [Chryseobacterium luteum]KFF00012.1 hypothetical protein IX38_18080 [Chryseobacterium luteum]